MRHIRLGVLGLTAALSVVPSAPCSAQDKALLHRVESLETQVGVLTEQLAALMRVATINVDCAAGDTIQAALARFHNHPAPLRINLFGVCSENLRVTRQVLIRAGAPGAGIAAADPNRAAVFIFANPGLGIGFLGLEGLTISGGVGVAHAQAVLTNCLVRGEGVSSNGGILRLERTVVEDGGGVHAGSGGHVFISGGAVRNNAGNGLTLDTGATADVRGSAEIESNAGGGIGVGNGSLLSLGAATVTGNGITGIFVSGGSTVALGKGAMITGNTQSGISLMDTSLLTKPRGEADIHITNNGRYGIVCSVPPAVAQIVGYTFQTGNVSGNALGNIDCPISPGPKSQ